jgi:hypothetical protein
MPCSFVLRLEQEAAASFTRKQQQRACERRAVSQINQAKTHMMHRFRSVCGHFVNVTPVQGDGKKWQIRGEDKWQVCVQGPQITKIFEKNLDARSD